MYYIFSRTINVFADGCHTTNCYSKCGESAYLNKILTGTEITLRFLRFDLSHLPKALSGLKPKKVTVHAQTVILNTRLDINYDLTIVARQVYLGHYASFRYDKTLYTYDMPMNTCVKSSIHSDCSSNTPMTLISYYGNGRVDIYAHGIMVSTSQYLM